MIVGIPGLTVAAVFSGAVIYVSGVEHPAREALDARGQLTQWKPSYARGARMQASLALVGFALGVVAWWQTRDARWLAGACVLLAGWLYTLLRIMPVNNALNATALGDGGAREWPVAREVGTPPCETNGARRCLDRDLRSGGG